MAGVPAGFACNTAFLELLKALHVGRGVRISPPEPPGFLVPSTAPGAHTNHVPIRRKHLVYTTFYSPFTERKDLVCMAKALVSENSLCM
ncbi:hypothetical protein Zmor_002017 [Zophobas morio]|uniref:Uncharacterized protein n=1 Tax=Zophobas morio TaxID=2755281 RepID=A0AA38J3C1_9CUCU|nr:hypothetical protein Zmor_002017 [Zophobas morio]